jgi:hypothetical protein
MDSLIKYNKNKYVMLTNFQNKKLVVNMIVTTSYPSFSFKNNIFFYKSSYETVQKVSYSLNAVMFDFVKIIEQTMLLQETLDSKNLN